MKCGAFNSGLTIHPDGKVSPCCLFDHNFFQDLHELDWSDPWKDLRDGRGCDACKHDGPTYKDTFDRYTNTQFKLKNLDVRNNNLCNLECSICNSYYSSKWAQRLGEQKFVATDFDVDLTHVDHIYFAGGEPLLNPKHWQVLESILDPSKVSLHYNSNLTTVKNIEKYWPQFESVTVNASMDGVGQIGEQLRYGTDFSKWENNLHYASKYAKIILNPTISVLNIFHLKDIEDWSSSYPISYNILTGPDYLCVSVLPQELKQQIPYIPDNAHLKQVLEQDFSHLFNHTMSFILLQDRIKGTDIWSHLPFEKYAIKEYMAP